MSEDQTANQALVEASDNQLGPGLLKAHLARKKAPHLGESTPKKNPVSEFILRLGK